MLLIVIYKFVQLATLLNVSIDFSSFLKNLIPFGFPGVESKLAANKDNFSSLCLLQSLKSNVKL